MAKTNRISVIAIAIIATIAVSSSLPCIADELDRSSAELAASLVMDKLRDDILSRSPDEESLYLTMIADPGAYVDPQESERKLRATFREKIAETYRAQADKLLRQLARSENVTNVFASKFMSESLSIGERRLNDTVVKTYPQAFENARKRACGEQAGKLSSDIRPSEAEVDELARDRLAELMTLRVADAQKTPVFKENMAYISAKIVDPMLDNAVKQRAAQADFFAKVRVDGFSPIVIESNLRSELDKFIVRKREDDKYAYGIFPSVTNNAAEAAERRSFSFAIREIPSAEVPVNTASILAEIEDAPEKHRTLNDSEIAFVPVFERKLFDSAIKTAAEMAPEQERVAFLENAEKRRLDDSAVTAVSAKVKKVLIPEIISIRDNCATAQLLKVFPDLAGRTWVPSGAFVDEICGKSDFRKSVLGWRKNAEMKRFADIESASLLMEETTGKLDVSIFGIFDTGRKARTAQHGAVDRLYKNIREKFSTETGKKADISEIEKTYTDLVANEWSGERESVLWDGADDSKKPANASQQYVDLFPSTREKIKIMSKVLFDDIQAEKEKPEEEPITPEETPPPEELEIIEMMCGIDIDRNGDNICFRLLLDGKNAGTFICDANPERYKKSSSETFDAISGMLEKTIREKIVKNRVSLTVGISVCDGFVYYGTVERLSEFISEQMNRFGNYLTALEISDTLK